MSLFCKTLKRLYTEGTLTESFIKRFQFLSPTYDSLKEHSNVTRARSFFDTELLCDVHKYLEVMALSDEQEASEKEQMRALMRFMKLIGRWDACEDSIKQKLEALLGTKPTEGLQKSSASKNITYTRSERMANALLISTRGDALGRVTEFIRSTEAIFERYPSGVRSPEDFRQNDWNKLPDKFYGGRVAPYTDDTRMAVLVCKALIESKGYNWDLERTMNAIALEFVDDYSNKQYGWAASYRVPGNSCLKGAQSASEKIRNGKNMAPRWWDAKRADGIGCGSVMRVFPFGLAFSNDIEKAKTWAVEHSKITHGSPMALAACAAMAVGVAHALNGQKNHEDIARCMITAAREYDESTAGKMREALLYAKKARVLLHAFFEHNILSALSSPKFRALHDEVFGKFQAWNADDAIAAALYVWMVFPEDYESALYMSIHTPGDSDSIAAMAGALVGAYMKTGKPIESKDIEDEHVLQELAQSLAYFDQTEKNSF